MSDQRDGFETEDARREDGDGGVRERIEQLADRARAGFDEGVVDALSWVLDTETRARVYVYLGQHPRSTGEEVAEGTGLHPSTVRATLEELVADGSAERHESGDGSDAEYTAVPPSDVVSGAVDPVREGLADAVRDEEGERSVSIDVESGSSADATVGETEADVETDLEGEAELDEEGARIEGEVGGDVDVETGDRDAEIEGSVDAEVGTDGVDVDVDADVSTPDRGDGDSDGDSDDAGDADAGDADDAGGDVDADESQ